VQDLNTGFSPGEWKRVFFNLCSLDLMNRPVNAAPPVREEGETTVISVVEEVLVVERRLVLKEEIRLRGQL
jgi:Domain of unknown function (DUF2382)